MQSLVFISLSLKFQDPKSILRNLIQTPLDNLLINLKTIQH